MVKANFLQTVKIGCTIATYLCSTFVKPKNNGISKRKYELNDMLMRVIIIIF